VSLSEQEIVDLADQIVLGLNLRTGAGEVTLRFADGCCQGYSVRQDFRRRKIDRSTERSSRALPAWPKTQGGIG